MYATIQRRWKQVKMVTQTILFILEIIGTIAFSISGTFVAIKAKFDVFGVIVIGCITSVGGGIMRDILIGNVPPTIFSRLYIMIIAALTSLAVFLIFYYSRKRSEVMRKKIEQINNVFDAMGLAAFTVMGTELAFTNGFSGNVFLSVILGVLTGVGGGLLRDILTETSPYIFKKHVYAVAAILGSLLYYLIKIWSNNSIFPSIAAIIFIFGIRILATKYRWRLPKITQ